MFNHPYAAAMLADQHRHDLEADAAHSRLVRQVDTKPPRLTAPSHSAAHPRRAIWPIRVHRRRPTATLT